MVQCVFVGGTLNALFISSFHSMYLSVICNKHQFVNQFRKQSHSMDIQSILQTLI